jgi:outer membrane protein assembly factor BamB
VTGSYASPSSRISLASSGPSTLTVPHIVPNRSPASSKTLVRDPFSFRQLLIASTAHGKLFALDTSTGAIVWSRILGLGWARQVGGRIVPVKAFTVRRTETGVEDGVPEGRDGIALITQKVADNVRILFFRCLPAVVVYFIDFWAG